MNTTQDIGNGLLASGNQVLGFLFNFQGQGAFSPDGKAGELTQTQVDTHNRALAELELERLKEIGQGILYLTNWHGVYFITQFSGDFRITPSRVRVSNHNMAGPKGRTDVWFQFDSSTWHGTNIGDNQILRVKRNKS